MCMHKESKTPVRTHPSEGRARTEKNKHTTLLQLAIEMHSHFGARLLWSMEDIYHPPPYMH